MFGTIGIDSHAEKNFLNIVQVILGLDNHSNR